MTDSDWKEERKTLQFKVSDHVFSMVHDVDSYSDLPQRILDNKQRFINRVMLLEMLAYIDDYFGTWKKYKDYMLDSHGERYTFFSMVRTFRKDFQEITTN